MFKSLTVKRALPAFTCIISIAAHAATADSPNQTTGLVVAGTANDPANRSDTGEAQLAEVIVSAQKRVENLQTVPISANVVTSKQLQLDNLNSVADLLDTMPSMHVDTDMGRASPIYIRGIGSGNGQSFDQSVPMFIDDLYFGRSRFSSATFLDVERVEVLNGPQSTYFGNNATAGALNIVTNKPGNTLDGYARALYGQYGQYATEAAVGGPITDQIGARVALIGEGQNGYVTNVDLDDHEPHERNWASRLTLAYDPTENLSAAIKLEYSQNRSSGMPLQISNCPRPAGIPNSYGTSLGSCALALSLGVPTNIDGYEDSHGPEQRDFNNGVYELTVNYHKWSQTFTSVTGYQNSAYNEDLNAAALPVNLVNVWLPEQYNQFSQELRVASPSTGAIEYLAGAYFQTDRLQYNQAFNLFSVGPFIGGLPPAEQINYTQGEHSYSAFASVSWNATDRLKVTAGERGSWVLKDYNYELFWGAATEPYGGVNRYPGTLCTSTAAATGVQAFAANLFASPACAFAGNRKDDAAYPSANIQFRINPNVMAYVRFDKSWKAGGFNGSDTSGEISSLPYGPEHVNAYEAGLKSTLFQDTLRMNVAIFREDYRDLQVTVNTIQPDGNVLNAVRNAASSRSQGVEFQSQWAPFKDFLISGTATYLDAVYESFPNSTLTFLETYCQTAPANPYCTGRFPAGVGEFDNLSGTQLPDAPKWSGTLTVSHSQDLWRGYRLTTEVNAIASANWYYNILDKLGGAYWMLGARLSLATPDGHWAFDVIGKNLNDETVLASAALAATPQTVVQPPRSVAAQIRYTF